MKFATVSSRLISTLNHPRGSSRSADATFARVAQISRPFIGRSAHRRPTKLDPAATSTSRFLHEADLTPGWIRSTTFCSMCSHLFARLSIDERNCRNRGRYRVLFYRSLTVTALQRRSGHAYTSMGYFLLHNNWRRGLRWRRTSSDTGRAYKAP
jgi:hypothetical protein